MILLTDLVKKVVFNDIHSHLVAFSSSSVIFYIESDYKD